MGDNVCDRINKILLDLHMHHGKDMEQHICHKNMSYTAKNPEFGFTKDETNQAQILLLATEMPRPHQLIACWHWFSA